MGRYKIELYCCMLFIKMQKKNYKNKYYFTVFSMLVIPLIQNATKPFLLDGSVDTLSKQHTLALVHFRFLCSVLCSLASAMV